MLNVWAKLPSYYASKSFVGLIPFKDHINIEAQVVISSKEELAGYKIKRNVADLFEMEKLSIWSK